MKAIVFFLFCVLSNVSVGVGWEEVPKSGTEKRGISITSEFNKSMGCNEIKILLPNKLLFEELGEREFWSVRYKVVSEKSRGWQLTSKGTYVILPFRTRNQTVKIDALCLSPTDLKTAYISVVYGSPQGAPPMVVVLNLGEYE